MISKKKKRSSPKFRAIFLPISQVQTFEGGLFSYGGGYFPFFTENRPQKHKKHAFLHTSQANGGGSSPPRPPPLGYATGGDRLKNFCEDLFFFGEHLRLCPWFLALASSIPVLGLESVCPRKGCPWPWPRIFFGSLALASDFFCVLGLGLEPCVLDSTSAL